MENGSTFSPALGLITPQFLEYSLIIQPDKEVYEKVKEEKERFSSDYQVSVAKKTVSQITVANFLAKEGMEETIIKWMQRIISAQRSFNVMLNNYSGFPSHTIYARVQDHNPFKQLATSLQVIDQFVKSNGCPPATLISHPHLAIAIRLQPQIYEKAIFDYSKKTFHAMFMAEELGLLKRQNHFDKCRQVSIFRLSESRQQLYN